MSPQEYGVLVQVSLGYPPVRGRLHTRYAPVRRSPAEYCYSLLPLDLHVLSLPLAFILSQDQTLHCKNCLFFQPLTRLRRAPRPAGSPTHAISCFQNFKVLLLSPEPPQGRPVFVESGCKDTTFFQTDKIFFRGIWNSDSVRAVSHKIVRGNFFDMEQIPRHRALKKAPKKTFFH